MQYAGPSPMIPRVIRRITISEGEEGVRQTVEEMWRLLKYSLGMPVYKDIAVRLVPAGQVLVGVPAYRQLYNGLKQTFRYVRDQQGVEELSRPDIHANRFMTLGYSYGDCDDAAIWAATLATALNLGPIRWVTIANGRRGRSLNHVFAEVDIDGTWMTLDFLSPNMKRVRTVYWRG